MLSKTPMKKKPNYRYLPSQGRTYYELLTVDHSRLLKDRGVLALGPDENGSARDVVPLARTVITVCGNLARSVRETEIVDLTLALCVAYQPKVTVRQTRSLLRLASDPATLEVATACRMDLIVFSSGLVSTIYDDFLIARLATEDDWQVFVMNAPIRTANSLAGAMAVVRELRRNGAHPLK